MCAYVDVRSCVCACVRECVCGCVLDVLACVCTYVCVCEHVLIYVLQFQYLCSHCRFLTCMHTAHSFTTFYFTRMQCSSGLPYKVGEVNLPAPKKLYWHTTGMHVVHMMLIPDMIIHFLCLGREVDADDMFS